VSDESLRLAHYAAEQRARDAAVPAVRPPAVVPVHSDEILGSHEGRPSVREQQRREVYP
jgi:hypothetical protein